LTCPLARLMTQTSPLNPYPYCFLKSLFSVRDERQVPVAILKGSYRLLSFF